MAKKFLNKKTLRSFLTEEEGKMVKKDALKLGLTVIAIANILGGILKKPEGAEAGQIHGSHGSHASHGSHGSHGSGGNGSWHTDGW